MGTTKARRIHWRHLDMIRSVRGFKWSREGGLGVPHQPRIKLVSILFSSQANRCTRYLRNMLRWLWRRWSSCLRRRNKATSMWSHLRMRKEVLLWERCQLPSNLCTQIWVAKVWYRITPVMESMRHCPRHFPKLLADASLCCLAFSWLLPMLLAIEAFEQSEPDTPTWGRVLLANRAISKSPICYWFLLDEAYTEWCNIGTLTILK